MGGPRLGDLEMSVMKAVWRLGRATVHDVRGGLEGRQLAYTTVLTTLRNLEKKGFLTHEVDGRSHVYAPLVAEREVERSTLGELLESVFDGSRARLVNALFAESDLTKTELERLRREVMRIREQEESDE